MWNGTAEILKASPAITNTRPKSTPIGAWPVSATARPLKLTVPAKPYISEMPYSSIPEESAPSTKYLRPASEARRLSRR